MKLKSLGILLISLLFAVAAVSSALLLFVANQFDTGMASAKKTYSGIILPLRQIDANTKNLRFHLYASFMHNPEQSVSPLHTHPLSAHTDTIRAEMAKNVRLWNDVESATRDYPRANLSEIKSLYDAYFSKGMEPGIRAVEAKDWTGIVRTVTATLPEYITFEKTLQTKIDALQTEESQLYVETHGQQRSLIAILMTGVLAILVGATIAIWKTISGYTARMTHAVLATEAMATGNLSQNLVTSGNSEASAMLRAMSNMQDAMRQLVGDIRSSSDCIHAAASEVALGNSDLSARTEQQAGSLEETASSMEQLTSTVTQNAENALKANQLAASASAVAVRGGQVVAQVVDTMDSINGAAKKIVDIIAVIDGIAFQTNILALNAAVEAARAGEQGRGFAVVASEVRNLAQRSAGAAKEIKELIGDSVEKIDGGTKLVAQAGATMDEIVTSVKRVTDIMSDISAASQEQTSGISQINQSIIQMDGVVQQNAALVEEASAAAMSLQEQAGSLTAAVSVFKLAITPGAEAVPRPVRASALDKARVAIAKPMPAVNERSAKVIARRPVKAVEKGADEWVEF